MIKQRFSAAVMLLFAGALSLSACASEAPQPAPKSDTNEVVETSDPDTKAETGTGDDGFNKSGVVMLVDGQFRAFGGKSQWEGDVLTTTFDAELEDVAGLELKFVCGFMNGLVLEEHATAVETPSGKTDCTD